VHIEHPLKPGVIMMSVCKCEHANPAVLAPDVPPWLKDWITKVMCCIEVDNDEGAGVHHIIKEEGETVEVHIWPAPFYVDGDEDEMTIGDMHAHLLPILGFFDGGRPDSMCFETGAVASVGYVAGRKVILLILDAPPDVYEDDKEEEEVPN
jgi:hypothetical protein